MTVRPKLGVIVARFQVPDLHPGHLHLVRSAQEQCDELMIVLGDHGGLRTDRDPLTFQERRLMVEERFPDMNIEIERLRDHPFSHNRWSNWLDELVGSKYGESRQVTMIGSRESFLDAYKESGKYAVQYIEPVSDVSGTDLRKSIMHSANMTAREAIIHHEQTRPAVAYSAADIAIVNDLSQRVVGISKRWFDGLYSLPGGFVDAEKDENDEDAARRERSEELPDIVTSDDYTQLGKRIRIDDPRYRKSKDKIYSSLFVTKHRDGALTPGDDAKGARWFERDELESMFVPWHQPLVKRLIERWDNQRK